MNSNDGTTAVQVSPIPTESEMASIRQIFTNVANALVRASELAKQVEDLEGRFKSLNEDHTRVMARSDQLEQALSEKRDQLNTTYAELTEVKAKLGASETEVGKLNSEADFALNKINGLEEELRQTKANYNDAMAEWHKAEARADEAQAGLAKVKSALGIVDPPKPVIAPQAEPIPQPSPTEVGEQVALNYPDDVGPARPLTSDEMNTPKEATDGVDFTKPYHWDATLNRWVND